MSWSPGPPLTLIWAWWWSVRYPVVVGVEFRELKTVSPQFVPGLFKVSLSEERLPAWIIVLVSDGVEVRPFPTGGLGWMLTAEPHEPLQQYAQLLCGQPRIDRQLSCNHCWRCVCVPELSRGGKGSARHCTGHCISLMDHAQC